MNLLDFESHLHMSQIFGPTTSVVSQYINHYYSFGVFEFELPAMVHKRHRLLYAVRKSTKEVTTLVRERVLPWYNGKGKEMENT